MSDSAAFQEVDEAVRKDELQEWWGRWGTWVVAAAVAVVVVVAGLVGWRQYDTASVPRPAPPIRRPWPRSGQDKAAARAELEKQANDAPEPYRSLAALIVAQLREHAGGAGGRRSSPSRRGCRPRTRRPRHVIAGFRSVDLPKADEMVAKLEPLAGPDRPFRLSVRELQALAAVRKGDIKRARELWTRDRQGSRHAAGRRTARLGDAQPLRPGRGEVESCGRIACRRPRPACCRRLLPCRCPAATSVTDIFGKTKPPLPGERVAVFSERSELEPDKEMASVQIVLPAPVGQRLLAAVRRLHQLRHAPSRGQRFAADHLDGRCRRRLVLLAHPDDAAGHGRGQGVRQGCRRAPSRPSNADTGQLIWRVTLKPEKARDGDEFGGGLAYYGGKLFVTTGFAAVYSLDPNDGKEIWTSTVSAPVRGAPLVFADRVFAISIDNKLQAMAAVDGSELWQFTALTESRGLCRRQQPGRLGRLYRGALQLGRAGRPARRQRPAGLERDAGRARAAKCAPSATWPIFAAVP